MAVERDAPEPVRPVRPYAVAAIAAGGWTGALVAARGTVEPDGVLTPAFLAVAVLGALVARFGFGVRFLLRRRHTDPLTRIEHVHHIAFFATGLLAVPALLLDELFTGAVGLWLPGGVVVAAPLVLTGLRTLRRAGRSAGTERPAAASATGAPRP